MGDKNKPTIKILFVCLGNICRSPMAEGAFRAAAETAGLDCLVDSVGTASFHVGDAPDRRAIAMARENGVDISSAVGRQIEASDFDRFSHIFALDQANLETIQARGPKEKRAKVALLLDAVPGRRGEAVADPYYGDEKDFAKAWRDIEVAVAALVARFKVEGVAATF
ncbi:MAG: low molecular weight protein-tyrosine-phosphatase [Pseudomonadota bacterium]